MKRGMAAILLAATLALVCLPATAHAAPEWQYTGDESTGLIVYAPAAQQHHYYKNFLSLEFDVKLSGHIDTDVYLADSEGKEVKRFDVLLATKANGSDRYGIQLDVSDVEVGQYTLVFTVTDPAGNTLTDNRAISINPGRWDDYDNQWYYYKEGAYLENCWEEIAGEWYHFDRDGVMSTGWQRLDDGSGNIGWYWFGSKGIMATGWQQVADAESGSNRWYCFNNDGMLFTNSWVRYGDDWFMVGDDGAMLTGWQQDRGNWYYMTPESGKMHAGWLDLDGNRYYIAPSGEMLTGTQTIDGQSYTFDSSGRLTN